MNGIQGRKAQNIEKHPGCLGRMVNLFDLSSGVPGNRLLTDKPHCDGSSISRSHSDVVRMLGPSFGDPLEDKVIVSELRRTSSNHRTYGTPMKTLIAEEMSKEVESKHNPPNLVARLMGLETLPRQQPNLAAHRSHSRGSSWRSLSHSEMPLECWGQDEGFLDKQMQCDVHHCQELNKCKDVYEIWQRSQKTSCLRDNSKQKGRYNDIANERNMALVRQKFMEAKRLATDEKLRESKEFQDALEVLNNNKELFLKLLQEPNSMFSQQLHSLQSLPPPPKTKRITVLRPSKTVENDKLPGAGKKSDRLTKKPAQIGQLTGWDRNNPGHPAQPTRIVVLKPSPGRPQDIKTVVFPSLSSPSILHGEAYYEEPEDEDALESREVAKEITRQMRDNLGGHRRDEILLSSVFPNGCNGDDSSFNKSEIDCAGGNLSDSEVMSPASRHSWDYINRFGSPISSPSFSRASCSSESSVCREAKKRLSERWAMMASNGKSEEHKHVRRSSNTLGEMLALSDTRKPARSDEEEGNKEQELRGSTSIEVDKEESINDSPKNLPRSKSVPVSSTAFGSMLNVGVSYLEGSKMLGPEEAIKAKASKSSLKGKVSSFFSSKNKKLSKQKSNASEPNKDDSPSSTPGTPVAPVIYLQKSNRDASQCVSNSSIEECLSPDLGRSGEHTPDLTSVGKKEGIVSREVVLSVAHPLMPGHASENLDQPSPISVLDPPFEEDETTIPESSSNIKLEYQGVEELPKSNLIDKSPPIESIARTLSWDDSCVETPTAYSSKPSSSPCGMEEEQDWFFFVQSLLSAAGLDPEVQTDSFIARWHLNESPLDPSLRDKYANLNEKEPVHESKRRQRRSNQKLAFDCVNAALLEITGYGSDSNMRTMSFGRLQSTPTEVAPPKLVDHLWAQMKDWFASNGKCTLADDGGSNSLVVERMINEELVRKGWTDQMKVEMDNVGKEIESKLVEELVEESVVDLTGRVV